MANGGNKDNSEEGAAAAASSLQGLLAALASGARAVHGLPLDDDFDFESSFPEFSKSLGETQGGLVQTLSLALKYTSSSSSNNEDGIDETLEPEDFQNIQDPLLWDACADACDMLLDQVEEFLKSDASVVDDDNIALATGVLSSFAERARQKSKSTLGRLVETTVDMEKPQGTYEIDTSALNDRTEPFVPNVHPEKPFSVKPLDLSLKPGHGLETRHGPLRPNVCVSSTLVAPAEYVPHVYESEINSFTYRSWQLEASKPERDIPVLSPLEATWVDTVQGLQVLVDKLEGVQEVAIDLEHHSYRSFAGILCLMQISFRKYPNDPNKKDMDNYLVDVFPLWQDINSHLAPMFANPDIVKVMHGADSDIQWLQRDFGIYVVNLFDTGRAARALGLSSAGLAFALQKYAKVEADKTHQLGDWRQRPLPDAMRQYAIMDTHYLLDIYDRMKWDLSQHKDTSIVQVLDTSRNVCLIRYAKDPFQPQGYKSLTKHRSGKKQKTQLNAQQERVLEKLWDWRDQTARNSDESPVYVCSNAVLLRISLSCPTTVTALQSLLNPIPPLVLHYATAVTQIVRKVRTNTSLPSGIQRAETPGGKQLREQSTVGAPSSAFFKPAEIASSEDHRRRSGVLSPVLGTEALYKQAGWTTPLGGSAQESDEGEGREKLLRRLVEDQDIELMHTTTEEEPDSDAALDSGHRSGASSKPRNLLSVNRANKDYRSQQGTSHSLSMGKSSKEGFSRGRTVDGMAAARVARENSSSPVPALSVEDEAKVAQKSAASIRSGLAMKEEMFGLMSTQDDLDDEDLDADDDIPQNRKAAANAGSKNKEGETGENEEEFFIPRSMREIYKISNRNRRNKKTASPTPERPSLLTSEAEMEHLANAEKILKDRGMEGKGYFDASIPAGGSKRQRTKSAGTDRDESGTPDISLNVSREDDVKFMQEIGWIKSKDEADKLLRGKGADPEAGSRSVAATPVDDDSHDFASGKGGRDSKTPTAFDYSSVGAIGAQNQPGSAATNPFFTGAALVGGPLAQASAGTKPDRKKGSSGGGRGGKQNRNRQERPEKRDGKTFAYRKR